MTSLVFLAGSLFFIEFITCPWNCAGDLSCLVLDDWQTAGCISTHRRSERSAHDTPRRKQFVQPSCQLFLFHWSATLMPYISPNAMQKWSTIQRSDTTFCSKDQRTNVFARQRIHMRSTDVKTPFLCVESPCASACCIQWDLYRIPKPTIPMWAQLVL